MKAEAIDAGTGSAEEFAALGSAVAGKVAVVTRSNDVSPNQRAVNALAAGATLLIVVNDADGELSEWVGADDYVTPVGIPVAAVSGVQGGRLLEAIASKKVTVRGVGEPTATETFDIANDTVGSIPTELRLSSRPTWRASTRRTTATPASSSASSATTTHPASTTARATCCAPSAASSAPSG